MQMWCTAGQKERLNTYFESNTIFRKLFILPIIYLDHCYLDEIIYGGPNNVVHSKSRLLLNLMEWLYTNSIYKSAYLKSTNSDGSFWAELYRKWNAESRGKTNRTKETQRNEDNFSIELITQEDECEECNVCNHFAGSKYRREHQCSNIACLQYSFDFLSATCNNTECDAEESSPLSVTWCYAKCYIVHLVTSIVYLLKYGTMQSVEQRIYCT